MSEVTCNVGDCGRSVIARGMCNAHYTRWRNGSNLYAPFRKIVPRAPGMVCQVEGCDRDVLVAAQMLCQAHYKRWQRKGSPGGPDLRPPYSGDVFSYRRAHELLQKERGRAADYPCAACGAPAHEWAYDHADPQERVVPEDAAQHAGFAYSLDFVHYSPMCRSCHRSADLNRGKHAASV